MEGDARLQILRLAVLANRLTLWSLIISKLFRKEDRARQRISASIAATTINTVWFLKGLDERMTIVQKSGNEPSDGVDCSLCSWFNFWAVRSIFRIEPDNWRKLDGVLAEGRAGGDRS